MSENDYGKFTIDVNNPSGFKVDTSNYTFIKPPERSEWQCYMFGNRPGSIGMIYRPDKGREPSWLARWFMRVCFDCMWVKDKPKPEKQSKKL